MDHPTHQLFTITNTNMKSLHQTRWKYTHKKLLQNQTQLCDIPVLQNHVHLKEDQKFKNKINCCQTDLYRLPPCDIRRRPQLLAFLFFFKNTASRIDQRTGNNKCCQKSVRIQLLLVTFLFIAKIINSIFVWNGSLNKVLCNCFEVVCGRFQGSLKIYSMKNWYGIPQLSFFLSTSLQLMHWYTRYYNKDQNRTTSYLHFPKINLLTLELQNK